MQAGAHLPTLGRMPLHVVMHGSQIGDEQGVYLPTLGHMPLHAIMHGLHASDEQEWHIHGQVGCRSEVFVNNAQGVAQMAMPLPTMWQVSALSSPHVSQLCHLPVSIRAPLCLSGSRWVGGHRSAFLSSPLRCPCIMRMLREAHA